MKHKYLIEIWEVVIFILIFNFFAYALDKDEDGPHLKEEHIGAIKKNQETLSEQEDIVEVGAGWAWGDVLFIDKEAGQFVVNYLDYNKLIKVDIVLCVDGKTVFENAQGLGQIKIDDNVSVDYIVTDSGKNIARLVTVDRLQQLNK